MGAPAGRNGWKIYFHPLFAARLAELRARHRRLRAELPKEDLESDAGVKLYLALLEIVHEKVPANPGHEDFRQGTTLGKANTNWRRVKHQGLPDNRLRLFFMFDSQAKVVVFAWLNDEATLRKAGSKTDVYATFQAMLRRGHPPGSMAQLLADIERHDEARRGGRA